jgi:pimeloyl-ACP methyl ester carboxylesterase
VVLVHGLVVSSRYMGPTFKRLAAYHRVYAPDLPGFSESEKPPRVLDVAGLSDSLAAWMREIGLERAALVGNCFGYPIIADLVVRHPERVERAVLQGPTMDPGRGPFWDRCGDSCSTRPTNPSPSSDRTPRLPLGRGAVLVSCGFYAVG